MRAIPTAGASGRRPTAVALGYFARRMLGLPSRTLESLAQKSWEIAPAESARSPGSFFLEGQLERVTGWAFASEDPRLSLGPMVSEHSATRGFLVKDVWMLDGALFKKDAYLWLTERRDRMPKVGAELEIDRGALYCTAMGNRYFGQWLMDDCVTYPLASEEGVPVATDQPVCAHTPAYEEWLGMRPSRLRSAHFKELVLFDDVGQNRNKRSRFLSLGEKLASRVDARSHPGVFIVRGSTGQPRLLKNEMEIAERLREKRGFRIVDPARSELPDIVAACAGARTVVGVEGSGLIHGVLALRSGGSILTLQPPNRFVAVFKHLADRDGENFGFVVGLPDGDGFRIDPDEVERTLDLFPVRDGR